MSAMENYVAEIAEYGRCSERYDHKKGNPAFRRVETALRAVRATEDKGEAVLISLLDHSNPWVRFLAATHLLPLRADLALSILEQIAAASQGVLRLQVDLVLQEWRHGRLEVP